MDLLFGAGIAQFCDLASELVGVADAVVPALVQVFVIAVEDARALQIPDDQRIDRRSVGERADGGGMQTQLTAIAALPSPCPNSR
ncbi:hypothetical protein ACFXG4_50370 [Nocardia sp. NPDC059246]|uniref:hypothetical protein n=1 Tax=unclassified Nocardia TaxID=2637762 RepID=UPI00369FE49D